MASTYPDTDDATADGSYTDDPDLELSVAAIMDTHGPEYRSQAIAYAAEITPNPALGEWHIVAALTGVVEFQNPAAANEIVGRKIKLSITQDGTGRAVTYDTKYLVKSGAVSETASAVSTLILEWNGTKWVQVGGANVLV